MSELKQELKQAQEALASREGRQRQAAAEAAVRGGDASASGVSGAGAARADVPPPMVSCARDRICGYLFSAYSMECRMCIAGFGAGTADPAAAAFWGAAVARVSRRG